MAKARQHTGLSGLAEPVVVVDHDPGWKDRFEEEAARIRGVLGPAAQLEHVGSTAVPGLAAKPVIDILAGLTSMGEAPAVVRALEAAGWVYAPEFEDEFPERRLFGRIDRGRRTHHLHLVETGGGFWHRHLRFRDWLRGSPEARRDYAALKRALAVQHADDRPAYTGGKTEFVESALRAELDSRRALLPALEVRFCRPEDAAAVHSVIRSAYADYSWLTPGSPAYRMTLEIAERELSEKRWVLGLAGEVPVATLFLTEEEDLSYIGRVGVHAAWQGGGVGGEFMRRIHRALAEEGVRRTRLAVRSQLPGNLAFYQRLGYRVVGQHPFQGCATHWWELTLDLEGNG
ncbi:MAG: GNAT family N-acetyltransferase [Candidatus Dormibacteria bacterium]